MTPIIKHIYFNHEYHNNMTADVILTFYNLTNTELNMLNSMKSETVYALLSVEAKKREVLKAILNGQIVLDEYDF